MSELKGDEELLSNELFVQSLLSCQELSERVPRVIVILCDGSSWTAAESHDYRYNDYYHHCYFGGKSGEGRRHATSAGAKAIS